MKGWCRKVWCPESWFDFRLFVYFILLCGTVFLIIFLTYEPSGDTGKAAVMEVRGPAADLARAYVTKTVLPTKDGQVRSLQKVGPRQASHLGNVP